MRKIEKISLIKQLPGDYRSDVEKAIHILTAEGCKEIYLFGSLVTGKGSPKSDIDLAVKGLNDRVFFEVLGKLLVTLHHPVDLLSLEDENRFVTLLKKRGEFVRVAWQNPGRHSYSIHLKWERMEELVKSLRIVWEKFKGEISAFATETALS